MKKWVGEFIGILIILMFLLLIFWGLASIVKGIKNTLYSKYEGNYTEYIVQANDTLWDIASYNLDSDQDIRQVIYEIKDDNNIVDCGNLKIGQVIKLRSE